MASEAFDRLAPRYDELWTHSTVGRLQREAVWRRLDLIFKLGDRILDLGCGTGEDACHFMRRGIEVRAIDASPKMVRIARTRGVDASILTIEELDRLPGCFDAVISNFGALNCVADLDGVRRPLARLVRPGGYLVVCVIGRFCLWESAWYLLRGQPRKTFRRWGGSATSSLGVRLNYFSMRRLKQALHPEFALKDWRGIGLAVPPSYVNGLPDPLLRWLGRLDRRIAHWPLLRALADHRLAIFARQ